MDLDLNSSDALPRPQGPIFLPANATFVSDADEEIFLLYTRLATLKPPDNNNDDNDDDDGGQQGHFHGLGFENSKEDVLLVRIELKPPPPPPPLRLLTTTPTTACEPGQLEQLDRNQKSSRRREDRREKQRKLRFEQGGPKGGAGPEPVVVLEYELFQDKTALRSRSGDTGSVLWKASIEFLSLVLRQLHFPEPAHHGLFDYTKLSQAHILELGAGTGFLAVALSPLARRYTATDIPALLPLLRKNVRSVPTSKRTTSTSTDPAAVTVAALDWTHPAQRQIDIDADPPDVLLVVDCIYHPTLVRPLLTTITALAGATAGAGAPRRRTVALVVAELRAEDVLREFLDGWIGLGWRVWSVAEGLLGPRWGMWVAWLES